MSAIKEFFEQISIKLNPKLLKNLVNKYIHKKQDELIKTIIYTTPNVLTYSVLRICAREGVYYSAH